MSSQNHTTKMKTAKTSTKKFLNVKPSANSIVILPCLSPTGRDAPRLADSARFRGTLLQQPDNLEHGYEQLECHESADRNDHGNRDLLMDSGHAGMGQHFEARLDVNLSAIPKPRTPSMPQEEINSPAQRRLPVDRRLLPRIHFSDRPG